MLVFLPQVPLTKETSKMEKTVGSRERSDPHLPEPATGTGQEG
jgi:hypothetical protein